MDQTEIQSFLMAARAARSAGDRKAALGLFEAAEALDSGNTQLKLDIATELRALDRSVDAERVYQDIRRSHPQNLAATIGLAQIKGQQRALEPALELFRQAHRLNHQHLGVRLEIGRLLRELNRLDEAEQAYQQILEEGIQDARASIGLSLVYRTRHEREKSLATLKAAAERDSKNLKLQLEIANDLRHLDRTIEAGLLLERIIAEDPQNFEARVALGHVKRQQGDRLGSLAQFQQAAVLNPGHAGPNLQAAQDLRELGRLDESEELLKKVLAQHPNNFDAVLGLAHIARKRGDRASSLAYFGRAAALNPQQIGPRVQYASDLRELGRLDEAQDAFNEIVRIAPDNIDALVGLAHVKRRAGDRAMSLAYFRRAAAHDPSRLNLQIQIAADLRELGQLDEAEATLINILEREPKHTDARVGLALIRRRRGDRHGSLSELQYAATLDPTHTGIRLELANDLRELGLVAEAFDTIKSVIALAPNHANAHAQLGQLHRARGRYQQARDCYSKALSLDPQNLSFQIERANCDRELGKTREAEAQLTELVAMHPDSIQAIVALATFLVEGYRLEEAKAVLARIENQENSVPALLALGRIHRRADQRSDALLCFQRAHAVEPENQVPLLELIQENRAAGNFSEALALNETLIGREASLQALLNRGRIHRDAGEHELAVAAFEFAITKFPQAWQARLELAIEHRLIGRPQETERILNSLMERDDENLPALDHMIEFLRMDERFEDALQLCFKAMSLRPSIHWPYLKAAHIAARLGKTEQTTKLLDDAERFAGPHPEIAAARIEILRFLRKHHAAEKALNELPAERADSFAIGVQGVHNAIALGQLDAAQERLGKLQPQTAIARAAVLRLRGKICELSWDHRSAIALYEHSLGADPQNSGTYHELAKCHLLLFQPSAALGHLRKSRELGKSAAILRGESHNFSQNHMGQLINEFLLDSELLTKLSALDQTDERDRLTRLTDLVRANPDHIPTAIGLLLALRKSGRLSLRTGQGTGPAIPRSVIQFWDSRDVPDEVLEIGASWRHHNPDFEHRLFNEEGAAEFIRTHHSRDVYSAFKLSREPAQKADFFRLAYLAIHGGYYADCDDRCATSLEEFVPSNATFTAYQEEYGTVGNNFIGVIPSHPVICRALNLAAEAVNRGDNDMVWLLTGPGLLTRAYASVIAEDPEEHLSKSAIFTVGEIQRYLELHCPLTYKFTSRHWLKSAFAGKRRKSIRR